MSATPPRSPSPRRPRARMLALTVAVMLVLSGNVAALVLIDRDDEVEPAAAPAPTAPATTTTNPPASSSTSVAETTTTAPRTPLEQAVADLSAFVADQRELEFLRPVEVELLDHDPFVARLLEDAEENREDTDQTEKVLRALGLLEPGIDLYESFIEYYGDAVIGFYDPETDELVLRGSELTPFVRTTLVHELAHALDDQHFELHRPALDEAVDETGIAFSALVEGVAVLVELGYESTLSDEEQDQSAREAAEFARRSAGASVPAIVSQLVQFPYLAGPTFVDALLGEGGEARIDAAFREPPTTSEQILDPSVYLAGNDPQVVAPPPSGGPIVDEGTFGQWALYLTLSEVLGTDGASAAAEGWGGDNYVAWDEGARSCVRASFAMDTPGDLSELDDAWRRWAAARSAATVESAAGIVTVTACG